MLKQIRLKSFLAYDPETGWFTNRQCRGPAQFGARAGSPSGHGYRKISIDGKAYYEHHLAWFYMTGEWPYEVDHKDRVRDNNAFSNLRLATRTENNFNSERPTGGSGLRGAYLDRRTMRWYSHIQIGGMVRHLGMFDSPEEAHEAFMAEVKLHHGEFAFHKEPTAKVGAN